MKIFFSVVYFANIISYSGIAQDIDSIEKNPFQILNKNLNEIRFLRDNFFRLGYGHYIYNQLCLGGDIGFSTTISYNTYVLGPFIRYYFLNKKITPLIELNYIYGHSIYKKEPYMNPMQLINLQFGMAFISKKVGLSIFCTGYYKIFMKEKTLNFDILGGMHFSYYFNR